MSKPWNHTNKPNFVYFSEKEGKGRKDRNPRDKKVDNESSDEEDSNQPGQSYFLIYFFFIYPKNPLLFVAVIYSCSPEKWSLSWMCKEG